MESWLQEIKDLHTENVDEVNKSFGEDPDELIKAKAVPVGTIRKRPNGMFIKTAMGWKYHSSHKTHSAKEGGKKETLSDVDTPISRMLKDSEKKYDSTKPSTWTDKQIADRHKEIKAAGESGASRNWSGTARMIAADVLVEHDKRKLGGKKESKPALKEVDAAISAAGKALADKKSPDAISALRDKAKKLGMAYGMDTKKIDEAISTSRKGHEGDKKSGPDNPMSFREVLANPEGKRLVEEIEWDSSDKKLIQDIKQELYEKTGFKYDDTVQSKKKSKHVSDMSSSELHSAASKIGVKGHEKMKDAQLKKELVGKNVEKQLAEFKAKKK